MVVRASEVVHVNFGMVTNMRFTLDPCTRARAIEWFLDF
jgi:hypothetical protein